jgi:hypothetical protein
VTDKSSCKVVNVKSGKQCTVQLSGKNATNLKTHLSRFHKEEFQLVETQDAEKEEASSNVSSCKRVRLDTQPKQATLMSCFSRTETNRVYAENSAEYNRCMEALLTMIIDTGCPLNFVGQRPFMHFAKVWMKIFCTRNRKFNRKLLE